MEHFNLQIWFVVYLNLTVDEGGDTFPEDIKRFSRDSEGKWNV